jgi:subtilisin family serine protease
VHFSRFGSMLLWLPVAVMMMRLAAGREEVPSQDLSGHGTHVAGIAAGNGRASGGRLRGVASEASLLIVKLGTPSESDFPRTTQVMTGVDFAVRFALERNLPLVINLSFGNNYGAHDGSTLLETYLNQIVGLGQITIVTGMGNQGSSEKHTSGLIEPDQALETSFIIGPGEQSFGLQIWKNYADVIHVSLQHPGGEILGPFYYDSGLSETSYKITKILFYYGEPVPYSVNQEIYITFLPAFANATAKFADT